MDKKIKGSQLRFNHKIEKIKNGRFCPYCDLDLKESVFQYRRTPVRVIIIRENERIVIACDNCNGDVISDLIAIPA